MSLWLTVSIWIIFVLWSLIEVAGIHALITIPHAQYSLTASVVTYLWVLFSVFWLSFQFIG